MVRSKVLLITGLVALMIGCADNSVKETVEQTHPNGQKKKVIQYVGNKKNLVRTTFYFEDGKVQSDQFFKAGVPDSTFTIYYKDGTKYKESHFANGKKNGPERAWFQNGKLQSEANYVDSIPDGAVVSYYESGKKASEMFFKNGKKEGLDITYDTAGQKKHLRTYVAGEVDGIEQEWYPNHNLKMEQTWKKSILNGPYTTYFKSGKKEETGTYLDGNYDGTRLMFNEQGKMLSKAIFEKGTLVDGTAY